MRLETCEDTLNGPSIAPFHVDASRIGGSVASQRHNFGLAKAPPKKPRFIPAPQKRDLGQGTPAPAQLTEAQIKGIQDASAPIIEALQLELEAVKVEADWVSAQTLRVEPDLYKSIGIIGPYFTPQEIRTQIIMDANELGTTASRILGGAIGYYISAAQKAALETVVSDAKELSNYVQQFDIAPLTGASARLAEDHLASHTQDILDSIKEVEKSIVTTEAGSIPVVEPMERGIGVGGLLAVGALIAVGIIVADLI